MVEVEFLVRTVFEVFDPRVGGEKVRLAEARLGDLEAELEKVPGAAVTALTAAMPRIATASGVPLWQKEQALVWTFGAAMDAAIRADQLPTVEKAIEENVRVLEKGPEPPSRGFYRAMAQGFARAPETQSLLRLIPKEERAAVRLA